MLQLSWSELVELIAIDDPWKRAFFENECLRGNWSVRQLRRQIESLLYERTGLSTNKRAVIERARRQAAAAPAESIDELIRDPYVLESAVREKAEPAVRERGRRHREGRPGRGARGFLDFHQQQAA